MGGSAARPMRTTPPDSRTPNCVLVGMLQAAAAAEADGRGQGLGMRVAMTPGATREGGSGPSSSTGGDSSGGSGGGGPRRTSNAGRGGGGGGSRAAGGGVAEVERLTQEMAGMKRKVRDTTEESWGGALRSELV